MDSELEVIRDDMHQTRASLADKLDALEGQVRETVQSATDTVTSTVDTVKQSVEDVTDTVKNTVEGVGDTVQSTVQGVAQAFDVSRYAERAPWTTFGVAVAAGFAGGYLLGGLGRDGGRREPSWSAPPAPAPAPPPTAVGRQEESWVGSLVPDTLGPAMTGLQGLAVGTLMGVVRDMVKTSLPGLGQLGHEVSGWIDNLTKSLGGKPMDLGTLQPGSSGSGRYEQGPGASATEVGGQVAPQAKRQERRRAANGQR